MTELHAMLKLHEQTLPKKEAAPALHAIRAGKDNPAMDSMCHQCGDVSLEAKLSPISCQVAEEQEAISKS
nr:hypothetical protein [Tanacetum cinerariifolium]